MKQINTFNKHLESTEYKDDIAWVWNIMQEFRSTIDLTISSVDKKLDDLSKKLDEAKKNIENEPQRMINSHEIFVSNFSHRTKRYPWNTTGKKNRRNDKCEDIEEYTNLDEASRAFIDYLILENTVDVTKAFLHNLLHIKEAHASIFSIYREDKKE